MSKAKLPRIEWEQKSYAGRIYVDDQHSYSSSVQCSVDGDEGLMHTLCGKTFFFVLERIRWGIFPPGVKYLNFTMREPTLQALIAVTESFLKVERGKTIKKNGRHLIKVRISRRNRK